MAWSSFSEHHMICQWMALNSVRTKIVHWPSQMCGYFTRVYTFHIWQVKMSTLNCFRGNNAKLYLCCRSQIVLQKDWIFEWCMTLSQSLTVSKACNFLLHEISILKANGLDQITAKFVYSKMFLFQKALMFFLWLNVKCLQPYLDWKISIWSQIRSTFSKIQKTFK